MSVVCITLGLYYSLFVDESVKMFFLSLDLYFEARRDQDIATILMSNCSDFEANFQVYMYVGFLGSDFKISLYF
jgi:hypothetical protein